MAANLLRDFTINGVPFTTENSESAIFKKVAEFIFEEMNKPGATKDTRFKVCMTSNSINPGDILSFDFIVKQRGTYVENGETRPSWYVALESINRNDPSGTIAKYNEDYHTIAEFEYDIPSEYDEAYLTCIHTESNNYKFYHLIPEKKQGDVWYIGATYGRIGGSDDGRYDKKSLAEPYMGLFYWIRYFEKLDKGYIDQSEQYLDEKVSPEQIRKEEGKDNISETEEESCKEKYSAEYKVLFDRLYSMARNKALETFKPVSVTRKQLAESRKILESLKNITDVDAFNKELQRLLVLVPRRAYKISDLLARDSGDIDKILDREDSNVHKMAGLIKKDNSNDNSIYDPDIEIYEATDEQKEKIKKLLPSDLQNKTCRVWRVIPQKQKERFDKYVKDHHIHKIKEFWHGSRNENWLSIMMNSLSLNPNAVRTGSMFGKGLYFAPSAKKSFGYTSYHGSYWAHGSQGYGYMGVYATAYGDNPLHTSHSQSDMNKTKLGNHTCLHAHAGAQLYNDEVIFYDEDAVLLNYIVEFFDGPAEPYR